MGFLPINVAGVDAATKLTYPPGQYAFKVQKVEVKPTKDGTAQRFVVESVILMGPGQSIEMQNKKFTTGFMLSEAARPFLVAFITACGLKNQVDAAGGQIAEEWFAGRQWVADLVEKNGFPNPENFMPFEAFGQGNGAALPAPPQSNLMQPMPTQQAAAPAPQYAQQAPQYAQQPQYAAPQAPQQPAYQAPFQGQLPQQPQYAQQPGIPAPMAPPQQGYQQPVAGMPAPPPPGMIPGQGQ